MRAPWECDGCGETFVGEPAYARLKLRDGVGPQNATWGDIVGYSYAICDACHTATTERFIRLLGDVERRP